MKKLELKDICLIGIMLSLAVVLSAFLQFRLIGDIKIDLSYLIIVIICYLYGGIVGGVFAGLVALLESLLFSAYGISISWISANLIIGLGTGMVMFYYQKKGKTILHLLAIIVSCAIGLLLAKTLIECGLYGIPFEIKIVKNAVAFLADCGCMVVGYFAILPIALIKKDKQ